jgi:para-nitrobenzyl esterase
MRLKNLLIITAIIIGLITGLLVYLGKDSIDLDNLVTTTGAINTPDPVTARETANGPVIGFSSSKNTFAWLGIPYGAPPVDQLRWKAPRPVQNWQQPLLALKNADPCPQPWTFLAAEGGSKGDMGGSEDCLYLNIWAPQKLSADSTDPSTKLPVMLWIHGGGNNLGSARFYQGHNIAADQQVIFVSLNYRLGQLGSLTHRAIRNTATNPEDASGNYGLLDIIAALGWVQANIHTFGGDADNVTVFGESAGGRNVFALMASPLATGLFHKAISQSGSSRTESLASAENFHDEQTQPGWPVSSNELVAQLLINLNIATDRSEAIGDVNNMTDAAIAGLLYKQSPEALMKANLQTARNRDRVHIPQLLRDGHVLPSQPFAEVFSNAETYNSVPMIIGSNRDEEKSLMASDPRFVDRQLGFRLNIKDRADYQRYAKYYSQRWHVLGGTEMARLMTGSQPSPQQNNIYSYRFDWDSSPKSWAANLPKLVGAGHGLEISFIFGDFAGGLRLPFLYGEETRDEREALSKAMMNYWGQFAHTGSPGKGRYLQQPDWIPWGENKPNTMIFDSVADGGWRMENYSPSVEDMITRIEADTEFKQQKDRCKLFVESFLISYHSSDFWDPERYSNLAGGGCREFDPYVFMDAF